jgi:hypothetical protein
MTSYFEYIEGRANMGDIVDFKQPEDHDIVEHVDASTIVERIKLTPELKAEFEKHGYTIEEDYNHED